ncbi:MAG TPA: transposase family protein, partial [Anaerovoracaceae bacterium]|nr:transposase family protein [Anaerovoracaceae bacterium]
AFECKEFAEQIAALNPDLPDPIFGFMDGVFFPNDNHPDPTIQNAYYNGWKSSTSVTNALVFTPDGCICWAAINRPGSWHDAKVVLPLYRLLKNDTPAGFKLIADAAFQAEPNHILTPFKKGQFSSDLTIAYLQLEQHYNVVSARQPAEWGMRSVQADFPRLKLPLAASNFEYNRVLIACCFRLYNYRTRRLRDLNQIKTVFSSDYLAPFV